MMTDSAETIRCTNCKRDILSANFVIHDIHCQRNIYLCPKCEEPVNHKYKAEHDEANHVLVYCTGCHAKIEKFLLNNHLSNDCPRRKVTCQICSIEMGAVDIVEHENYCGARTEKCPECGEFIMLKYKQLHIDSNHVFTKLSDEPGPSPSWQNGRRTLGNFLPDFQSISSQSHQKKRSGRNENSRRRSKGSPESIQKPDDSDKDSSTFSDKQRFSLAKRTDRNSLNSTDYKDVKSRFHSSKKSLSCETGLSMSNAVDSTSDKTVNTQAGRSKKGVESSTVDGSVSKKKTIEKTSNDGKTSASSDDDPSLALAIELSEELNCAFHLDDDEIIAQAIEGKRLNEYGVFDSLEKNKSSNLSKNIYSDKKPSKTVTKTQLKYDSDDSDDEFLLYSKKEKSVGRNGLPCNFCGMLFPMDVLTSHEMKCVTFRELIRGRSRKKSGCTTEKESVIPCAICYRVFPRSQFNSHMQVPFCVVEKLKSLVWWKRFRMRTILNDWPWIGNESLSCLGKNQRRPKQKLPLIVVIVFITSRIY